MDAMPLSDIQRSNLAMLMALRELSLRDPAQASCDFHASRDLIQALLALSPPEMVDTVARLGNSCLFCPREDLRELLHLPAPLAVAVAAARPPRTAMGPQAQVSFASL